MIDVALASRFLAGRVHKTPVEPSPWGRLKLESRQITGSFKLRGAWFKLSRLPSGAEVAAASAGNHGLGVAYAARECGQRATIYVPATVDAAKAAGIQALGATLVRSPFDGYDDTAAWATERAAQAGQTWVSAYEDPDVIAGNGGSIASELFEQAPDADVFVVPAGGGGMLAGLVAALGAEDAPAVRVVAVQHEGCPALKWSLERGAAVTRTEPFDTLAGGLEGGFGALNFELVRGRVEVVTVSEAELLDAMRALWDSNREVCEPSGAAAVAALRAGRVGPAARPVGIVSGRNVARGTLARILGGS